MLEWALLFEANTASPHYNYRNFKSFLVRWNVCLSTVWVPDRTAVDNIFSLWYDATGTWVRLLRSNGECIVPSVRTFISYQSTAHDLANCKLHFSYTQIVLQFNPVSDNIHFSRQMQEFVCLFFHCEKPLCRIQQWVRAYSGNVVCLWCHCALTEYFSSKCDNDTCPHKVAAFTSTSSRPCLSKHFTSMARAVVQTFSPFSSCVCTF